MKIFRWTVLFLALTPFAVAQPATFHYNFTVTVKQGMAQQYEEYVRKIVEAAKKNGDAQPWYTFQSAVGGTGRQYTAVLPHENWAERDSWSAPQQMLAKAFGDEEAAKITRAGMLAIASSETTESRLMTGLSTHVERDEGVRARYLVSTSRVKSGKFGDYMSALRKIRAAEAKADGSPRRITRRRALGDTAIFTSAAGFDTGADRDKWPAFGDYMSAVYTEREIREILDMITNASESRVVVEIAYRPDLSNPQARSTSN